MTFLFCLFCLSRLFWEDGPGSTTEGVANLGFGCNDIFSLVKAFLGSEEEISWMWAQFSNFVHGCWQPMLHHR